jgi:hypothetical protein
MLAWFGELHPKELRMMGASKSAIDWWEQRPATFIPLDKQNPPGGDAKR